MFTKGHSFRIIACMVALILTLGTFLPAVQVAAAEATHVVNFDDDAVDTAYNEFYVTETDGRKYLKSNKGEFVASSNLYAGELGNAISENLEISVEFMFPAGSEGILWIFAKGMSPKNDFQMMDVAYMGGVTRVYAQDVDNLCDVPDVSGTGVKVQPDTWHTMKVVKQSSLFALYLDNVKVAEYTYENTNSAPTEIYLMQYLTLGSGACFDTFALSAAEQEEPPVAINEHIVDFNNDAVGTQSGDFFVAESEGEKYLQSNKSEFGASFNLYAGQLGDKISENFELSVDIMYPAGTEGVLWLFAKGMSPKNDLQMMNIHYQGGVTRVYAQDVDNLCDVPDISGTGVKVQPDTWHTMKVVKQGSLFELYLDNVKIAEYTYENTNYAPTEIYVMQFLTAGSGARFDNLVLKKVEKFQDPDDGDNDPDNGENPPSTGDTDIFASLAVMLMASVATVVLVTKKRNVFDA